MRVCREDSEFQRAHLCEVPKKLLQVSVQLKEQSSIIKLKLVMEGWQESGHAGPLKSVNRVGLYFKRMRSRGEL